MCRLPFSSYARISLRSRDLVVESQQAILPLSLRTCWNKRRLDVVVHQRVWKCSGYTTTSNVAQSGGMSIFARFLKIEDEENTVIGVLKSYPIFIEDIGGKLMRVAR